MFNRIKEIVKSIHISRIMIQGAIFVFLFSILIYRLFYLQVKNGVNIGASSVQSTNKQRAIKNTRGNIYDRNGNILARSRLAFNITIEDNGEYVTAREKQLTLNSIAYRIIRKVNSNQETLNNELKISIDESGNYCFNIKGVALDRFRADIYGKVKIDDMTEEEASATAEDIIKYLCSENKFALYQEKEEKYTDAELEQYQLSSQYTKLEILNIIGIRYMLSLHSFQRYLPITVATDVSEETVSYILENEDCLPGVDITEDSIRIYEGGESFAHILGYTGIISSEELEELKQQNANYSETSIVGKTGIEQFMENTLQGTDGKEELYVNNVGKILEKSDDIVEPIAGNDVYLSIDKDLQIATYKILEQQIAGILVANISNINEFDKSHVQDASDILIPINDVYYALLNNDIININHFEEKDATEVEKKIREKFIDTQKRVLDEISGTLIDDARVYKDLDSELQEYHRYIVDEILPNDLGCLNETAIDKDDEIYIAWTSTGTISLKDYIAYAIDKRWIDISKLPTKLTYLDSEQANQLVNKEIIKQLELDKEFGKKIYRSMLRNNEITGVEICRLLYEQGVLSKSDTEYDALLSGKINSYEFIVNKIRNLEITPAQLALDPCSGSVVIVQPQTGDVLACVTYPGYDNNRLANKMDSQYYNQLINDLSLPLYNRATQQLTAPGSTFKPITAIAGLQEQVISSNTSVYCDGVFDKVQPKLHCWNRNGHGEVLSVTNALKNSCNDYFCELSYRMGMVGNSQYSERQALQYLQTYAKLFDLDKKSGIELTESKPHITDQYAIPSSIGQGTHNYTTIQLARYVTTLATSGTSYHLSLLNKVLDSDGTTIEKYSSCIQSKIELPSRTWSDIRLGMQQVVENNNMMKDLKISAVGKTGTAEEVKTRPNHGLFIGYAPMEEPELAIAVRIANGYSSGNAAAVAKDVFNYYFELEERASILTGSASQASSNAHID